MDRNFLNLKFALFLINFFNFYFRVVIVMKSTVEEGGEERLGGKGNSMILATLTLFFYAQAGLSPCRSPLL